MDNAACRATALPREEPFFDVRCLTSLSTFWSQSRGSPSTRRAGRTPVMYDWEAIPTEGGGVKPNPKRSSRLRYMDFMRSPRSKAIPWGIAVGFVLISGLYLGLPIRHLDDRVYLIGWQNSPPFQQRAADGSPAGLAVDLVRDAARRRGIRLKWIWHPGSSEAALRNRQVDLWPL